MTISQSKSLICTPFTARPRSRMRDMQPRRFVVKSHNRPSDEDRTSFVSHIGQFCAPFAAAVLLLAQAPGPALAESNPVADSFENTLKRQQDLDANKLDFNKFFGKFKDSAKNAAEATKDASDPSKASTSLPTKIPTFGKPGEKEFKQTAKEGTKDNTGAGSNSNAQSTATPAFANKDEEASLQKAEKFQQKSETGNPDKPRLDPSLVENEPEPGPAPGSPNKLPEQPKPEPGSYTQLGKDSSGGKVQESKRGSGPLDLFGGGPSGETPTSKAETLIEKSEEPQSGNILDFFQKGLGGQSSLPQDRSNNVGTIADLDPPQPSQAIEKLPESAPGDQNDLPEQPAPEAPPPSELGKDSAGGKTGSTKSGGGPLDFFGGSSNNQSALPQSRAGMTLASNNQQGGFVYLLGAVEAPQPTELDEPEPKAAPGEDAELAPDQPRPEPASKQTPSDSAGGRTGSTKSGGGPLDFFGGTPNNQSAVPQRRDGITLASNAQQGGFVYLLGAVEAPQPTELDEPEPKAAPGEDAELAPDQPRPEPANKQTPSDSAGGKTEDTKRGSAPLDVFGGPDTGNAEKAADKNIQKAASLEIAPVQSSEVAQIAEEEEGGADDGKATLIGVFASIALEIAILSTYKHPEGHGGHH